MNIIYGPKSIEALQPYLEIVKRYPNPPTGPDGPIKWASIIEALKILEKNPYRNIILDIGSGNSALPIMLADPDLLEFNVKCIDNRDVHPDVKTHPNIEWCIGDAFEYINSLKDGGLDYAIDSCAVIHFNTTSDIGYNDGLVKISQLLNKKLKKGGKFILVSDFSMDHTMGEFICTEHIIEDIESGGLKLYSKWPDYPDDRFIQQYNGYELGIVRLIFEKPI